MYFDSLTEPRQAGAAVRPLQSLDDRFTHDHGHYYLTGIQALVRLCLNQRARDLAAGMDTAGYVSGYRGSPLGPLDKEFWRAETHLQRAQVRFQPAINEEMAATAVLGSQQIDLFAGRRHDGVFALWYGKGPGVDRAADALKHGNFAGTHRHGGVLVLAGDDHGAYSSSIAHQSDQLLMSCFIPMLLPAGVQEFLDLGIHGWALSRFSGLWIGMKAVADTVESSAIVDVSAARVRLEYPRDFYLPKGGINLRWPDTRFDQERRLIEHRLSAVHAYVRANALNRVTHGDPDARLGIAASGKSYLDVLKALEDLGITASGIAAAGIRLFKVALPWPLEPESAREFARGLEEIIVVEEKRPLIESQLRELLYDLPDGQRPRIIGKDIVPAERGFERTLLLPQTLDFSPAEVALLLAARLAPKLSNPVMRGRVAQIRERHKARDLLSHKRTPYYCSGCPHNTSTKVPEGSHALAGVGCHWMATDITPASTLTYAQMGGEGINWMGLAAFTNTPHVFANLGDGTYFHSGLLAIRQALAARMNITYKLLYNDAVAMTGGQPVDGSLSIAAMVAQLRAEGVRHIEVLSEDPARLPELGVKVQHRNRLHAIQEQLRAQAGVSVLIYDQTCATEKLRRRKRGKYPDPALRTLINQAVCEGCGDCGQQSNCTAIVPVETELGRKRAIDQTLCNKDFSCQKGFCPSFVSVEGGRLKQPQAPANLDGELGALPSPAINALIKPHRVLIVGIGGSGVLTASAILGIAAQIDGKGVLVLDMTGMSQKNGSVSSHVQIAAAQDALTAARLSAGDADVLLAFDLAGAATAEVQTKLAPGRTHIVGNLHRVMPGAFARQPDLELPLDRVQAALTGEYGATQTHWVDANAQCQALFGHTTAVNVFMLGYAWQKGLLPVTRAAIERALELNGQGAPANRRAFSWGRLSAHDPEAVKRKSNAAIASPPYSLSQVLEDRALRLTDYQDAAYAQRYRDLVRRCATAEQAVKPGSEALALAVARAHYKLLAYKDEYEVARLYTATGFLRQIRDQFDGDVKLGFHLAPPLFARRDPDSGLLMKRRFGAWVIPVFRVLARMKGIRGTPWDPFGYSADRRLERQLIRDFEGLVAEELPLLTPDNHTTVVALIALHERIRGYGHVKVRSVEALAFERNGLLAQLRKGAPA